jgi:hypothetical protein
MPTLQNRCKSEPQIPPLWREESRPSLEITMLGGPCSREELNVKFRRTSMADRKCADGRSCVRPRCDDEIDGVGIVGERDICGRRFVGLHPVRMGVVDAEEFETPLAEFAHQAHDFPGCDLVIPHGISRHVFRRESLGDHAVLPSEDPTAFPVRLTAGMREEFAA